MQNTTNPYETPQASLSGGLNTTSTNLASKGQRFGTYVIDTILFYILFFIIGLIMAAADDEQIPQDSTITVVSLLIMIAYYTIQETISGQTIGKRIMKTKAVRLNDEPISGSQAFGRTLCRFIPFEALSIFFTDTMWHDSIAKTKVISLK